MELINPIMERAELLATNGIMQGTQNPSRFYARYNTLLKGLYKRIDDYEKETSCENWDDEHGKAISASQWQHARELIACVQGALSSLPVPSVDPCGDGFIHICWSKSNGDRALFEVGSKECWWSLLSVDRSKPAEVVQVNRLDTLFEKLNRIFGE